MVSSIGGIILIGMALVYFAFKLRVIYWVARDPQSAGGVPTLDTVIFPPIFCTLGAWFLADATAASFWQYLSLWLVVTLFAVGCVIITSRLGRR